MKNNKYGLTVTSIKKYGFKKSVEIWEKYDKKCSVCGSQDKLAVHHIDGSGKSKKPNNEVDNLQLVCCSCHMKYHSTKYWAERAEIRGGYITKGKLEEYHREYSKKHHQENRERRLENLRKWQAEHKGYLNEWRKKKKLAGLLTPNQLTRKEEE